MEETGEEVVVWAELPGLSEAELDVQVRGDTLTVRARDFSRGVRIPAGVSPGKVQATYINGLLELRVPKA